MNKRFTCLVTGGAGFIGSHVVERLIALGYKPIVLDDLSGGFRENIPQKAIFVKGSITNKILLERLFKTYRFDYVFHLAAYAAEGLSHFIKNFNYTNNLIGSVNLINLSVKYSVKRFVFTSSIAVYGSNQTPFTENTIPIPEDPYGIAKYAVELDLKNAYRMFGLHYTIFRPHNVYGERQNIYDPFRNVIGIFMNQILHKKPLSIFGDGTQTRAFSYINDVSPYIANCINIKKAENEIINIGADTPCKVLDLAYIVSDAMNVKPKITFLPQRAEVVHAFSNHDKAKKIFNISKTVPLKIGIFKMAEWVQTCRSQKYHHNMHLELSKNLPKSWKSLFDKNH